MFKNMQINVSPKLKMTSFNDFQFTVIENIHILTLLKSRQTISHRKQSCRTRLRIIMFLSFLQAQSNRVTDVCLFLNSLQTGSANGYFGILLVELSHQNVNKYRLNCCLNCGLKLTACENCS